MRLFLDTHALAWWLLDDPNLSQVARAAIEEAETIVVSAVTVFEAATKHRLGKWPDGRLLIEALPPLLLRGDVRALPMTIVHATEAGLLPAAHRDPFDRILAAQALVEDLTLVTRDPAFAAFGIRTLW